MQVIRNNPYRIIGILAGASLREQTRQANRLKQFVEAEQEVTDDFSFPALGHLNRTVNSINEAVAKLNLNNDKINAALFWFYNENHIDEASFESIKESNPQNAMHVWERKVASGEVTQSNHSAFQNLSTLKLLYAFQNGTVNKSHLEEGITLKLKFLESEFIHDLKALTTDETYKINKKELELYFLKQVYTELEKTGSGAPKTFLEIIKTQSFSAREDFLKQFIQQPIEEIEKQVEACKTKRKGKNNAIGAGATLYNETKPVLDTLRSVLGTSNLSFQSISDKVSDEVLQCGIEFFNDNSDDDTLDAGKPAMELFMKAKGLAIGSVARQRCEENIEDLQVWIDDKPNRDKQNRIIRDLDALKNLIIEYEGYNESVGNAKNLLSRARTHLNNVKSVLGATDEYYLTISTRIAYAAEGMMVAEINKLQQKVSQAYDSTSKRTAFLVLKQKVDEAWEVTNTIGNMDVVQDFKARYYTNRTSLYNVKNQLSNISGGSSGGGSGGGGCYIATMSYGDYDHPQVQILRKFRDEALSNTRAGQLFIKYYYRFSPALVEKLKNKKFINKMIRKSIDQLIKLIKK